MAEQKYKFTRKDKSELGGLCRFLLGVAEHSPVKQITFKYSKNTKFNIGTLVFERQRDHDSKEFDSIKIVRKTKT